MLPAPTFRDIQAVSFSKESSGRKLLRLAFGTFTVTCSSLLIP
ncbi:MAG: hypothetical protein Nkreftii_001298 [Candidatus Nitrospira kreftii]|uniref:Uncharacterized protein n=1 Tax=Candidatus Nitrospira kreftii TaxID=2652173 RepID=A0A7S8IYX5_9BACT|nr:MAG: hypothetical protein Nkreftii_001298 [Candidatus Nitrospira kreftii]